MYGTESQLTIASLIVIHDLYIHTIEYYMYVQ